MAATGFTPIQLYRTSTASAVPSAGNLADGELAINLTDERLYFKNAGGTVKLLAANITPVANGGTGSTSLTANNVLLGNGTSALQVVAPGANGNLLTSNGTTWVSQAAPAGSQWTTSGSNISYTAGQVQIGTGSAAAPALSVASDTNTGIFFPAADTIAFAEGGAEVARFDSSGNLGLGVTPSAWSGISGAAFELKGNAYQYSTSGVMSLGANAFFNGTNWIYRTTQAASRYEQVNGVHQWGIAPSGTAGNAISFTQAMTLGADGNLGVGTTSPGARLHVRNNLCNIYLNPVSNAEARIQAEGETAGTGTAITFYTYSGSANGERARITSAGDVGIGTSSPAYTVDVRTNSSNALRVGSVSNSFGTLLQWDNPSGIARVTSLGGYPLDLGTDSTTRFRIGTSGQFGIGGANYGTSGQVLTSQGSGAAPVWATVGGSPIVLVSSFTTSLATTITIDSSIITSAYDNYLVTFDGTTPNSPGTYADIYYQLNNGSTWVQSGYNLWNNFGGSAGQASNQTEVRINGSGQGSSQPYLDPSYPIYFEVYLIRVNATTGVRLCRHSGSFSVGNNWAVNFIGASYAQDNFGGNSVRGIRFFNGQSVGMTGRVRVFGIRNS